MTISVKVFFWILGTVLVSIGTLILRDRKHPKRAFAGIFWIVYGSIFLGDAVLPPAVTGVLVITMAIMAGSNLVAGAPPAIPSQERRRASAVRLGNLLFLPALTIPSTTVIGTLIAPHLLFSGKPLIDPKDATLVSFGIGCMISFAFSCILTRESVPQGVREARRLVDALSWAVVLPQMLGMLGLVFADAGVGKAVAYLTTTYINLDTRLLAVVVYCTGMAVFTMIMGNGYAAFPVMTGGIGIPVLMGVFHANPAPMAAIGMFSGYCGTLLTPMAANYNIVPAALLELPDKHGVIRAQAPTAILLLMVNVILLYIFM